MKFLKSKKGMILVLVLLVGVAGAYKTVLKPKKKGVVPRLPGTLLNFSQPFVLNLADGRYAKVSVSVLLENVNAKSLTPDSNGNIPVPQEPAMRAVVTDMLTGAPASELIDPAPRRSLVQRLLKAMRASTDNVIDKVFLTDITVQ
ncbi:MAG: flagellar basal body-associated FliL family protein [Actinobacteria bacterium]|nr:flagellar basal body-associated FliL family protein [Actinomycetota bacterium]MBV8561994.1 flagellar basal body-associated FliL family protein [Actinomycetota bacterium]